VSVGSPGINRMTMKMSIELSTINAALVATRFTT
jgi:hypothetical protein